MNDEVAEAFRVLSRYNIYPDIVISELKEILNETITNDIVVNYANINGENNFNLQ